MAVIRTRRATGLTPEDLALAVFGPWDPRAQCAATPTVLWDPRVDTRRLRALWVQHQGAIEAAALAAHVAEPWIVARLEFCDALDAPVSPVREDPIT